MEIITLNIIVAEYPVNSQLSNTTDMHTVHAHRMGLKCVLFQDEIYLFVYC